MEEKRGKSEKTGNALNERPIKILTKNDV